MRFVTPEDLEKSDELWEALPDEGEMIVTENGSPIAVLIAVSEFDAEDVIAALRCGRAATAIARLQLASMRNGTDALTSKEVEREIEHVRYSRSR